VAKGDFSRPGIIYKFLYLKGIMLYKTRAIVLRDYELAEQDKIIEVFSEKYGRIKLVAKGARRLKSRFAPTTQIISYVDILAYQSRKLDLDTLSECQPISLFLLIKKDLLRMASANYVTELAAKLTPIHERNAAIFVLLLKTLSLLEKLPKDKLDLLLRAFELRFLRLLGYSPTLRRCLNCGRKLEALKTCYFSVEGGGILCEVCAKGKKISTISKGSIKSMLYLSHSKLDDIKNLRVDRNGLRELEILPSLYIPYHSGELISGYNFLKELTREENKR